MSADHSATPASMIDLERYPITALNHHSGRALAARCRAQLDRTGACELPDFIVPEAIALLERECEMLSATAYRSVSVGTPYLEVPDMTLPEDHPRRIFDHTAVGVVAYDQFPGGSAMRELYEWDPLMEFIAAALDKPRLYRYADPFGALNLAVMGAGDRLHWHYDQTDFVVSLALRPAAAGGDFEYSPAIRSADNENYPAVKKLLLGSRDGVVRVPMNPGTLLLFEGRNSIHRVTTISGPTTRLMALLAYDTSPGTRSSKLLQMARYGRSAD